MLPKEGTKGKFPGRGRGDPEHFSGALTRGGKERPGKRVRVRGSAPVRQAGGFRRLTRARDLWAPSVSSWPPAGRLTRAWKRKRQRFRCDAR